MSRIRIVAALVAAVAFAACTDSPTAVVERGAIAASLSSESDCSPYLDGPTAVNSGTEYTYRIYGALPGCISSVSWSVFGGSYTSAGGKAWVTPHVTNCLQVSATVSFASGGSQEYTVLAKVNGYKGTCGIIG